MKFCVLVKKYPDGKIIIELKKHYKDIKDESYIRALSELRVLEPSDEEQDVKIHVSYDEEVEYPYLDCDGMCPDENGRIITWGIEY